MNQANLRRIVNEVKDIERTRKEDESMFVLKRVSDDMFHWEAIIIAPKDSLYEGYKFKLDIQLPGDYPLSPMKVKFITPILHVNVNTEGDICLDILKNNWSSALNIKSVMISLLALLDKPNTDDPLNSDLAELYRTNKSIYLSRIKDHCAKHAIVN